MSTLYQKLKGLVDSMDESGDVDKFESGERGSNQSGARLRKTLQEIKKTCQEYRTDIQAKVNSRKKAK